MAASRLWPFLTALLLAAALAASSDTTCADRWAAARATLDRYALVMDLAVAQDRQLHQTLPPQLERALAGLVDGGCARDAADAAERLLPAAIRAVHRAHAHITKDLLATGRADNVTRATVHAAAHAWLYVLVDRLLAAVGAGAPVARLASDGGDGLTAVHLAVLFRERWVLTRLLAQPALAGGVTAALDAGAAGQFDMTPLHLAVVNADADLVAALLDAGASVWVRDVYGRTPWEIALQLRYDATATVLAMVLATVLATTPGALAPTCPAASVSGGTARRCAAPAGSAALLLPQQVPQVAATPWCPFARVHADALDAAAFVREHVSLRRPVIVAGALDAWPVRRTWQAASLRARYADRPVQVGDIPYADVFGGRKRTVPLAQYLGYLDRCPRPPTGSDGALPALGAGGSSTTVAPPPPAQRPPSWPPMYVFDAQLLEADRGFFEPDANPLPPAFASLADRAAARVWQFFLGPTWSGAPHHYHCDAVNALVRGRKRWLLLPPAAAYYARQAPVLDPQTWASLQVGDPATAPYGDAARPFVCDQAEGELVYVPGFWGHAVVNTDEAIGFAIEFDLGDC